MPQIIIIWKHLLLGLLLTDVLCVFVFSENRPQEVDDLPVMQTEQDDMLPTIPTPVCADHAGKGVPYSMTSALKKARYRKRKCFLTAGKRMSSLKKVGLTGPKTTQATMTPESKKIKENFNKQLKNLQQKRNKMSIAKQRLLLETQGWQLEPQQCSPYKRIKWNPSTLAAVQFMEDQSVFLPCKRSVLKKTWGEESPAKTDEETA